MNIPSTSKKRGRVLKIIGIFAIVLLILTLGGILYGKYQLTQWLKDNQADVEFKKIAPTFNKKGCLSLNIEDLKLSFKDPVSSLKTISFHKGVVNIKPSFSRQMFFLGLEFPFEMKDLKLNFRNQSCVESKIASGSLVRKWNFYSIENILIEELKSAFQHSSSPSEKPQFSHVIIYKIEGDISFEINSKKIRTKLFVPPANLQMPPGKAYSVKAHGEAKLLEEKDLEVPLEGKIWVEIKDIANFLSHLHQIEIVSLLENNLATVVGYFPSQENLQALKSQHLLEKKITLEINLDSKGAYVGPVRVYP